VLAEATTHLVSHIRGDAQQQTVPDDKERLMGAARTVADATTRMIDVSLPPTAAKVARIRDSSF